jgi:DNA polymerase III delta prime subunit
VHAALLHAIRHPAGASLILVCGPTGVGKTTLRHRIAEQLLEDGTASPTSHPGHIPVVAMEAASPDSGSFHWKDYYTRALLALDEPFIADKITYDVRDMHRDEQGRLVIERNLTIPDLRRALEKTLLYRQPRAFIVDEAQHLRKMTSGRRLLDQMDNLKSLSGMTDTLHVLVGTYELLGLMDLSAQLARRSREIHFPRYHADKPEDLKEFSKLLRTLQKHLPLAEEPDLESHADYFYEHCLGCTGMLKTWLNRTLAAALEQEARTLTAKHWKQYAQPRRKLVQMVREINEGEQLLQEDDTLRLELRTLLKLESSEVKGRSTEVAPKKQSTPVGQRAPQRDQVGGESEPAQ